MIKGTHSPEFKMVESSLTSESRGINAAVLIVAVSSNTNFGPAISILLEFFHALDGHALMVQILPLPIKAFFEIKSRATPVPLCFN